MVVPLDQLDQLGPDITPWEPLRKLPKLDQTTLQRTETLRLQHLQGTYCQPCE